MLLMSVCVARLTERKGYRFWEVIKVWPHCCLWTTCNYFYRNMHNGSESQEDGQKDSDSVAFPASELEEWANFGDDDIMQQQSILQSEEAQKIPYVGDKASCNMGFIEKSFIWVIFILLITSPLHYHWLVKMLRINLLVNLSLALLGIVCMLFHSDGKLYF